MQFHTTTKNSFKRQEELLKLRLKLDMQLIMQNREDWNRIYLELPEILFFPFHQLQFFRTTENKEERERFNFYILRGQNGNSLIPKLAKLQN